MTVITWLLLLSLLCKSTQAARGRDNGVCGPQSLTLTSSDQTLLLTWEDDPSCSALQDVLIYQVVVYRADEQVHEAEVAVAPDRIGATHSWNWTSTLALECASHSVRLSSRYNNYTSQWVQGRTPPGEAGKQRSGRTGVYPRDRLFEVGSEVTFCCILQAGEQFKEMYLTQYNGTNMRTAAISQQTHALTLNLSQASSDGCVDVKCRTSGGSYGACVYVGYPPADRDLRCETRDLRSVDCDWTVGRDTHLFIKSPTEYRLLGSQCVNGHEGRCSQQIMPLDAGERTWTLTAQNKLGKVALCDRADLTKRVRMLAPEGVTASTVTARNISLEWRWTVHQYKDLNLTCQVSVSHGDANTIRESVGVGLNAAVFSGLIPSWTYDVAVRCRTAQHVWKWGDWSDSVPVHTKGDVPDALDVWMQMKDRQAVIVWKMPLANQSHGHIIGYEVAWTKAGERGRQHTALPRSEHSITLRLNTEEEHIVAVTAKNVNGSSSPSTIIVPRLSPDTSFTSQITGSNGSFTLSWSASPTASCGYIVDWRPTIGGGAVEWLKVPPSQTTARVFSEDLEDGLRYSLSIHACTQGAPVLLERREGYVNETRLRDTLFETLKYEQQDADVTISWDRIPLREQPAFIRGYNLYYWDDSRVFSESTDDPEATSLTARNLKIGSYTFTVTARTAVGECGNTSITATLNSQTDTLIKSVLVCLGAVFGLLSLTTLLCYRNWQCIKDRVYPPIPKPVLSDKWSTSAGDGLYVDPGHSEADIMDIPELQFQPEAPVSGYVSSEDVPFAFTQTPKRYYNDCVPPPPTTIISSLPALPSSMIRGGLPNPSYNLIMETADQQSSSGPEVQGSSPVTSSSDDYRPQSPEDSPMSCVFTYILLPQTNHT